VIELRHFRAARRRAWLRAAHEPAGLLALALCFYIWIMGLGLSRQVAVVVEVEVPAERLVRLAGPPTAARKPAKVRERVAEAPQPILERTPKTVRDTPQPSPVELVDLPDPEPEDPFGDPADGAAVDDVDPGRDGLSGLRDRSLDEEDTIDKPPEDPLDQDDGEDVGDAQLRACSLVREHSPTAVELLGPADPDLEAWKRALADCRVSGGGPVDASVDWGRVLAAMQTWIKTSHS